MCSWYTLLESPVKFSLDEQSTTHEYISTHLYLCTLTYKCFETHEGGLSSSSDSVIEVDLHKRYLATAKNLTLTSNTLSQFERLMLTSTSTEAKGSKNDPILVQDGQQVVVENMWTRCGSIMLRKKEKQDILSGKELCDLHINAFQNLMKVQFPMLGGLQSTLLQHKYSFSKEDIEASKTILQIIHMSHTTCSHWVALQVIKKELHFYDSAYSNISAGTLQVIAQLMKSSDKSIDIKLMNVSKQSGSVDCGLYAIATITSLALGKDPTTEVFHQDKMRSHLIKIFETKIFHYSLYKSTENQ